MKKNIFLMLLIISMNSKSFSQEIRGKVTYTISNKIVVKTDTIKNAKLKSLFNKILKNTNTTNILFQLTFNDKRSFFHFNETMDVDNSKINLMLVYAQSIGNIFTYFSSKKTVTKFEDIPYLVEDSFSQFHWELTQETKKNGKFICYKATGIKKVYRRRRKSYKTIKVIAWYAPEIPVSTGPAGYGGLPGLILEVEEENTIKFYATKINLNIRKKVKTPPKLKIVKREEFNRLKI